MLGNDDLGPEPQPRAPDLSIEEMLRRAREARLGDTPPTTLATVPSPRFVPLTTTERRVASVQWWLHSCTVLVLGLLLGALIMYMAVGMNGSLGGTPLSVTTQNAPDSASFQSTQPTDTPLPTPTDTPVPTATDTPSPAPTVAPRYPTADAIVSLVQDYIDNESDYAGSYVMTGDELLQIRSQDETQLSVCIQFDLASIANPDTVVGTDTRLFMFSPTDDGDGTWQVTQMGNSASCNLS